MRLKRLGLVTICLLLAVAHGYSFLQSIGLGSTFLQSLSGKHKNVTLGNSNSTESTVSPDSLSTESNVAVTQESPELQTSDNSTTAEISNVNETSTQKAS